MRTPLEIPVPPAEELDALNKLYRTTKEVQLRTRAQMVLLARGAALDRSGYCRHRARR